VARCGGHRKGGVAAGERRRGESWRVGAEEGVTEGAGARGGEAGEGGCGAGGE